MNRRHKAKIIFAVSATIAVFVGLTRMSSALHRQTPAIFQVTNQPNGTVDKISSWDPQYWAFNASGDVIGNGNSTPQIFFYDHALRVLGGAPLAITQITCGDVNASHPSAAHYKNRVAFEADGMLCGDPRANCAPNSNPTSGRQIFMYEPGSGFIYQLTRCPGDCTNPNLSGNGKMLVFESTNQLIGGGAVGTVKELYQANLRHIGNYCEQVPCGDAAFTGLIRLTNGGGENAVQSSSGKIVAFESTGDLVHGGANPGLRHVYRLNVLTKELREIAPDPTFETTEPSISASGRVVAFTEQQPIPGNPTPVRQIRLALFDSKGNLRRIKKVTEEPIDSFAPSLDSLGRRIAFLSGADLIGHGLPGNQVYSYDSKRSLLKQVTAGPNGGNAPSASWGLFVGFSSQDDLIGNSNTTPQFFIANIYKDPPGIFGSPFPGTATPHPSATPSPTPTPFIGIPANISLALLTDEAADNGDNTLTTVIAATVSDALGNPVPDGTAVQFSVVAPTGGLVVSNGTTNADPDCDVSRFVAKTGVEIVNRTGVVHVCLTYPGAYAGEQRDVVAISGPARCIGGSTAYQPCTNDGECLPILLCSTSPGTTCIYDRDCPGGGTCDLYPATCEPSARGTGTLTLPLPANDCSMNGAPCSDFNPCTVGDVCGGGLPDRACVGGAMNGQPCTSDAQCPDLRVCVLGSNEGNPCNDNFDCLGGGTCQLRSASAGCQFTTPPTCQPGAPVLCPDDGNACTEDVCNFFTGSCGMPRECVDDGNPCTDDVCNPADGACGIFNTVPCEDGNPCTYSDTCLDGACQPGTTITCPDDLNLCTLDVCNPTTGKCGVRIDPCGCSAPASTLTPTPTPTPP